MDNDRPTLDSKHLSDICPDKNGMSKLNWRFNDIKLTWVIFQVPIIAVFTKYDQFKRNIKMKLEDEVHEGRGPEKFFEIEVESVFNDQYLASLGKTTSFVRLESEDFFKNQFTPVVIFVLQKCTSLIKSVLTLLKRLLMHLVGTWLPSCSWPCSAITSS